MRLSGVGITFSAHPGRGLPGVDFTDSTVRVGRNGLPAGPPSRASRFGFGLAPGCPPKCASGGLRWLVLRTAQSRHSHARRRDRVELARRSGAPGDLYGARQRTRLSDVGARQDRRDAWSRWPRPDGGPHRANAAYWLGRCRAPAPLSLKGRVSALNVIPQLVRFCRCLQPGVAAI